jgi:predicted nucleotidyltransferase
MNNSFGIYRQSFNLLTESVKKFPEIEKAVIFGSRAMGNYKKGSDIDLAIFGQKVNFDITSRLSGLLNEELPIPYYTDVLNFNTIENEELKQHILTEGKVLYKK